MEQIKGVFSEAFQHIYWVSVFFALAVVVTSLFLKREVLSVSSSRQEGNSLDA